VSEPFYANTARMTGADLDSLARETSAIADEVASGLESVVGSLGDDKYGMAFKEVLIPAVGSTADLLAGVGDLARGVQTNLATTAQGVVNADQVSTEAATGLGVHIA
jgi:hypothetical protein